MIVGDLVKWTDPGKDAVGIVLAPPADRNWHRDARVEVSWCSAKGVTVSYPRLFQIELVEPRKIDEGR